jgi:catechol 2,3-dioxygenase-like lactoylglutathione lyase family enzyme
MKQVGFTLLATLLLICCLSNLQYAQAHPAAFHAIKNASAHHAKFDKKADLPQVNMSRLNETATKLNIRMIPHTHDDIGWLKTVDQYFIDSEKQITIQGVQYILDSVFPVLNMDGSKRFIYVEMGFFQRWWREQEQNIQDIVKAIVKSGQLEFINGGYCMNDEAAVYYEDSIDQMYIGHQFLLQTFGAIPQVGWHIDPFGHASAQAALFAQMGFKAFYFARIDYQDKQKRLGNSGMEMVWIPNTSQGIENAMFTHVNYQHYSNPPGFNFDIIGSDQPINDDLELEGYDVPQRADQFVAWFRQMQAQYKSPDLMHTAGDDFHYMAAHMNFKNYDRLFKYIRNTPGYNVNVFYNTPTEYLNQIYPQNIVYPTKTDDFFPYADGDNAYWTGYFTSRVAYKGLVRRSGEFLQATRKLIAQAMWDKSSNYLNNNFITVDKAIYKLEDAMGMAQHHDAVTGTEKQAVAEDYKLHMARGIDTIKQGALYPYLQEKVQADLGISNAQFDTCNLNSSAVFCGVTYQNLGKNTSVLLTIYNSGKARNSTIRVKVPNGYVQVKDSTGNLLPTDVICSNSTDSTDCNLFFTNAFTGFGISYFYLVPSATSNQVTAQPFAAGKTYQISPSQSIVVNDKLSFGLKYCTDASQSNCYNTQFSIKYNYYEGYQGNGQKSGAYIFRPSDKTKNGALSYATPQSFSIYQGKNLIQIHVDSTKIISDLRIYKDISTGLELQSFVDSIDISDSQGKEVVLVVNAPSIQNSNTFYTDSMGMELQQRIVNFRPTWDLKVTQPIAGNYYPVQSTILINDTTTHESLAVIPDRSQGGASISQGEVELMIHRRLVNDDARGVDEALNEKDWDGKGMRQWVTHTLLFNKPGFISTSHREVQLHRDTANIVILAPTSKTPSLNKTETKTVGGFVQVSGSIKLMTRPMGTNRFLLRFQNMDETTSQDVSTQVFSNSNYAKSVVTEMSLTANQAKTEMISKRFNWNGLKLNDPSIAKTDYLTSDHFTLRPLEIRTFIVQFGASSPSKNFRSIEI